MYSLFAFGALIASVSAHGHVASITVGSATYTGYDPAFAYQTPTPSVPGWTAENLDNGYISPDSFSDSNIICHKAATPGQAYVEVAAGEDMQIQWNTWPDGHHGPMIDYLASCDNGDCTTVDKTTLSFVKTQARGWVSGTNPGTWATDTMYNNNYTHTTTIPAGLAPGLYVLRHEIISLHTAQSANGAQAYPQCINLNVTGSGSTAISGGVVATEFYTPTDDGILFNLYTDFSSYTIPGPALWSGAVSTKLRRHVKDFGPN